MKGVVLVRCLMNLAVLDVVRVFVLAVCFLSGISHRIVAKGTLLDLTPFIIPCYHFSDPI